MSVMVIILVALAQCSISDALLQPILTECSPQAVAAFNKLQTKIDVFLNSGWKSVSDLMEENESLKPNTLILKLAARLLLLAPCDHWGYHDWDHNGLIPGVVGGALNIVDTILNTILPFWDRPNPLTTTTPRPPPEPTCYNNYLVAYVIVKQYTLPIFSQILQNQVQPGFLTTDLLSLGMLNDTRNALIDLDKSCQSFLDTFCGNAAILFCPK